MSSIDSGYYDCGNLNFDNIRSRMHKGKILGEEEVIQLLDSLAEVLQSEENVLILQSPITICGDLHGQYEDVELLFEKATTDIRSDRFLFMGDYVDRGHHSLNTFLLLVTYKLQYPGQYFLLRGNHESRQVTQQYGFQLEVITKYGHTGLWARCMHVFDLLPYAAVVDRDIFSVHGGLSPRLIFIEQINRKERRKELTANGMLGELAWSDPDDSGNSGFRHNPRGAGFTFGKDAVRQFCRINRLNLVTRSHQLVQEGFKWYFGEAGERFPGMLINVWSAPNYAYTAKNRASFFKVRYPGQEEAVLPTFEEQVQEKRITIVEADVSKYFA